MKKECIKLGVKDASYKNTPMILLYNKHTTNIANIMLLIFIVVQDQNKK